MSLGPEFRQNFGFNGQGKVTAFQLIFQISINNFSQLPFARLIGSRATLGERTGGWDQFYLNN
jgi:hypothetical protein